MKMMKTEMEFVTFDAQDVITTSFTVSYFSGALKDSRGAGTAFNDTSDSWFVSTGTNEGLDKSQSTINGGNWEWNNSGTFSAYYIINSVGYQTGGQGKTYTITATGSLSAPTDGEYLDTLEKVFDYLRAHAQ